MVYGSGNASDSRDFEAEADGRVSVPVQKPGTDEAGNDGDDYVDRLGKNGENLQIYTSA